MQNSIHYYSLASLVWDTTCTFCAVVSEEVNNCISEQKILYVIYTEMCFSQAVCHKANKCYNIAKFWYS